MRRRIPLCIAMLCFPLISGADAGPMRSFPVGTWSGLLTVTNPNGSTHHFPAKWSTQDGAHIMIEQFNGAANALRIMALEFDPDGSCRDTAERAIGTCHDKVLDLISRIPVGNGRLLVRSSRIEVGAESIAFHGTYEVFSAKGVSETGKVLTEGTLKLHEEAALGKSGRTNSASG